MLNTNENSKKYYIFGDVYGLCRIVSATKLANRQIYDKIEIN